MIFIRKQNMENKKILNETIINGSKVFIDNGEVKTILNEDIQNTEYMSVEEMGNILHAYVNNLEKIYKR